MFFMGTTLNSQCYYYHHSVFNIGEKGIDKVLYIMNDVSKVLFIMGVKNCDYSVKLILEIYVGIEALFLSGQKVIIISVMKSIRIKFHLKSRLFKLIEFV